MKLGYLFRGMVLHGTFLMLILTGCAELDTLIPKTPPASGEWNQLRNDRRLAPRFATQALINTKELADKSMNRMDMEKLKRDYTEIRDLDKALREQLIHSITVGVNPADDYPGIRRHMRDIHERVGNLDAYLKKTSVVPWKGINTDNGAYKYDTGISDVTGIWRGWQLKQENVRDKVRSNLSGASLPAFEQLETEFGK